VETATSDVHPPNVERQYNKPLFPFLRIRGARRRRRELRRELRAGADRIAVRVGKLECKLVRPANLVLLDLQSHEDP